MTLPIEDYALIGDCRTAALIGTDGSIDWLCCPRFDSEACFAALLGTPENGRWQIAPSDPNAKITRRYRPDTLILETRYETETGTATLIDFMYPLEKHPHIVRFVVGEKGSVEFETELPIANPDHILGRCIPRKRLDDLLTGPGCSRRFGDIEVHDLASCIVEDQEHEEHPEGRSRHGEEID